MRCCRCGLNQCGLQVYHRFVWICQCSFCRHGIANSVLSCFRALCTAIHFFFLLFFSCSRQFIEQATKFKRTHILIQYKHFATILHRFTCKHEIEKWTLFMCNEMQFYYRKSWITKAATPQPIQISFRHFKPREPLASHSIYHLA